MVRLGQVERVDRRAHVQQPGVALGRADPERRVPHPQPRVAALAEYVFGPPQYCIRNSVSRSAAGPRSSSGYIGRSSGSVATPA